MQVLFRTVYGSALYGTSTPNSDADYVTIYLPSLTEVLVGRLPQKVRESSTNKGDGKNVSSDVDEKFVTVQKFASDFYEGKQYAVEVAFAAIWTKAEKMDTGFFCLNNWLTSQVVSSRALLDDNAVLGLTEAALEAQRRGDNKKAYSSLRLVTTSLELRQNAYLSYPMLNATLLREIKQGNGSVEGYVDWVRRAQKEAPTSRLVSNSHMGRESFDERLATYIADIYGLKND